MTYWPGHIISKGRQLCSISLLTVPSRTDVKSSGTSRGFSAIAECLLYAALDFRYTSGLVRAAYLCWSRVNTRAPHVEHHASLSLNLRHAWHRRPGLILCFQLPAAGRGHKLATGCHEYSITTYSRLCGVRRTAGRARLMWLVAASRCNFRRRRPSCACIVAEERTVSALYVKWPSTLNWPQLVVAESARQRPASVVRW